MRRRSAGLVRFSTGVHSLSAQSLRLGIERTLSKGKADTQPVTVVQSAKLVQCFRTF